jgi:hypothetical protein
VGRPGERCRQRLTGGGSRFQAPTKEEKEVGERREGGGGGESLLQKGSHWEGFRWGLFCLGREALSLPLSSPCNLSMLNLLLIDLKIVLIPNEKGLREVTRLKHMQLRSL